MFRRRIREQFGDLRGIRLDGDAVDGVGATIVPAAGVTEAAAASVSR
jgi:hypothetical protein